MTTATTDAAELAGRVTEARAELAALLEQVRALATALDHATVPATAETTCADTVHYLRETVLRLGGAETMLDEAVRAARGITDQG